MVISCAPAVLKSINIRQQDKNLFMNTNQVLGFKDML